MFIEPVSKKDFFGRDEVLKTLSKRVEALKSGYRQNVALAGRMLSGKSSILQHFLECLEDTSIVPVYIEVADEPFNIFAYKFMAGLLYNFLKSENIQSQKDLDELIKICEQNLPRTTRVIKEININLSKRDYNRSYRMLLELTSVFKEETGKSCIVILDEFHNLEHFKIRNPYIFLGKMIMIQKSTMYIVSSSQQNKIRKILSEKLSLLYGNFEIIEVSGFDSKTAKFFIKEKIAPINISDYYLDYILSLTDRNPFYLDVISKSLKLLAEKNKVLRVNAELLKDVLSEVLFNSTGTINQHFTNNIHFLFDKSVRKEFINILFAIACGANKIKEISTSLVIYKIKDLPKKLNHLINEDIIYKCGVFYKIQDRLFEFWLKNVYFNNKKIIAGNRDERISEFRETIENDIEKYLIEYNKSTIERLKELFQSFNGEIVEIDRKLRKLPKFIRIEALKYGEDKNYLACQENNKYWICQIKHAKAEESDIIDFLGNINAGGEKAARQILIPLNGIDSNALLLAKEKHLWVWKPKSLNCLSRLYKERDIII